MALWTYTEMSEILECSPQNVNQQKAKLKKLGYIEVDPTDNKEKINENGYNYLLNKRKATMQMNGNSSNVLNNTCLNNTQNTDNNSNTGFKQDTFIIDLLQKENAELKKQVQYWQELYVQQNEDIKKITFPVMLGTEEINRKQEEETKKGFFSRFFK